MAQSVKVFEVKETEPKEPLPFNIRAERLDGSIEDHQFDAYGEAPAGTFLALASIVRTGKRGQQTIDFNGIAQFLELVLPAEDYRRFRDLMDDPKLVIQMETLMEVYTWLTEEYFGRPTKRSPTSSNGRSRTSHGSTDTPSSMEEI